MLLLRFRKNGLFLICFSLALVVNSCCYAKDFKQWKQCSLDQDCIAVGMMCAIDAVNVKYKEEAHKYLMDLNSRMDCNVSYKTPLPSVKCAENKKLCSSSDGSKLSSGQNCHLEKGHCELVTYSND